MIFRLQNQGICAQWQLYFFFSFSIPFSSFSSQLALIRTSNIILNRNDDNRHLFKKITDFFFLLEKGKGREGEREKERTLIYCSTYSCIHWLLLVCALTRDQTFNLGISEQCSNQLCYLASATVDIFILFLISEENASTFHH